MDPLKEVLLTRTSFRGSRKMDPLKAEKMMPVGGSARDRIDNGERQIGVKPPPGFSQVVSAWFQLVSTGFGRA